MKVLDLQCSREHRFEGWFGSEDDFCQQLEQGLLQCPVCGDAGIVKRLSAPRLNLGGVRESGAQSDTLADAPATSPGTFSVQEAWVALARRMMANTDDVGTGFAEEARRMHYGETEHRGIRGEATLDEALQLIDEGIDILPLPAALVRKGSLQ